MRFRDVVLCDNPACGAILRLAGEASIRVQLEDDAAGTHFICPRCRSRTAVDVDVPDAPPAAPLRPARGPRLR